MPCFFHRSALTDNAIAAATPSPSVVAIAMPRKAGAQNYKKEVLLEVMATFLPNQGSNSWDRVAAAYQEKSGEAELRDKEDLKRHWREKCCNKFKKPTGKSGAATDFILRCQRVQLMIHKKNESSLLGDGSGNSSESDDDEDNDTSWMEELQEEGTSAALESVSVNNNTEIASGVTDVVNSPSGCAVAAEEGVTDVNGEGKMFLNIHIVSKWNFNLLIFSFKNLLTCLHQVLMKVLQQTELARM